MRLVYGCWRYLESFSAQVTGVENHDPTVNTPHFVQPWGLSLSYNVALDLALEDGSTSHVFNDSSSSLFSSLFLHRF